MKSSNQRKVSLTVIMLYLIYVLIYLQMPLHCFSCSTDLILSNRMLLYRFCQVFPQNHFFSTFFLYVGAVVPQLDQCQGAVLLWKQCTDGCSVYNTSTEAFLQALSDTYASKLPERGAGFTDTGMCVCCALMHEQTLQNELLGDWFLI